MSPRKKQNLSDNCLKAATSCADNATTIVAAGDEDDDEDDDDDDAVAAPFFAEEVVCGLDGATSSTETVIEVCARLQRAQSSKASFDVNDDDDINEDEDDDVDCD